MNIVKNWSIFGSYSWLNHYFNSNHRTSLHQWNQIWRKGTTPKLDLLLSFDTFLFKETIMGSTNLIFQLVFDLRVRSVFLFSISGNYPFTICILESFHTCRMVKIRKYVRLCQVYHNFLAKSDLSFQLQMLLLVFS